jgi:hypothetical protein
MPKDLLGEDFSPQVLAQTSQNIHKLFELSTRIDERVKNIQNKQEEFEEKLENSTKYTNELVQRLIIVEQRNGQAAREYVEGVRKEMAVIDHRVITLEHSQKRSEGNWNLIFDYTLKLIWCVLAAFLLYKLKLQAPIGP